MDNEERVFFCDCNLRYVKTFEIPYGFTRIGSEAFRGFQNLKSVTIPNSVTTIGDFAFCGCRKLVIRTPWMSDAHFWAKKKGVREGRW